MTDPNARCTQCRRTFETCRCGGTRRTPMNFRQAITTLVGELTPQPWEYTDSTGVTLTVIPDGLPADPGDAEVTVKVTAGRGLAAQIGVTTTAMPGLLAALSDRAAWEYEATVGDWLDITPAVYGGVLLTVTEVHYGPTAREGETPVVVWVPEAQRMPLASALRRATDVATGWER